MRRAAAVIFATMWLTPAATAAHPGLAVAFSVNPTTVDAGKPVRVVMHVFDVRNGVRTLSDAHHFHLVATSPTGKRLGIVLRRASRGTFVGTVRFAVAGRWRLSLRDWPGSGPGPVVRVQVRRAGPTPPPAGFASLGGPSCNPASPRNPAGNAVARSEVFGTTLHGRFWGLFASLSPDSFASPTRAVLHGVVGKELKLVFKLDAFPTAFFAIAPDAALHSPTFGPTLHGSSSWTRSGTEWGAGFVFDRPGCWKIHAAAGETAGDIWLQILS
jgi:hypothetical protein